MWGENMLGYLSLDIICSSKLTVFLELRSRKTVRFSEQIMSADKYPSIFSRQMEAIVYIYNDQDVHLYDWITSKTKEKIKKLSIKHTSTEWSRYFRTWVETTFSC